MSVYLRDIPLQEAISKLDQALEAEGYGQVLGKEKLALNEDLVNRVLAEPVWAKISSPHYHAAAMDGFSVRSKDTEGADPSTPITLILPDNARYVDTGDAITGIFNAVIPIENVEPVNELGQVAADPRNPAGIRIRAAVPPWMHVRPLGEDIVASELVLSAGHTLRPVDLGAIAAAGHTQVVVARRPKVAILPTGTELVPIGTDLKPGDILEFNSLVMAGQVNAFGGDATRLPITPDDFETILAQIRKAAGEFDLILVNAGSSAGSEDFSSRVVQALGQLLVHGVAVRPGHPVIIGMLDSKSSADKAKKTPIIGVPGYPVSAAMTLDIFVEPVIARWLGRPKHKRPVISAQLTRKINSPAGDDDYVRVVVGKVGEKMVVSPLARGAGVITSLVRADGIVVLPRGIQGVDAGEIVPVHLYRHQPDLENTIFCIGSHDMTLDLLAQFLAEHDRRLVSANVGSLGGLVALRRNEAHLAGSHLLDPVTGNYNLSYVREYLPGRSIQVFGFVKRKQGLLVKKGNPKSIRDLDDLVREQVTFINRQRGSGTRVLLDYHLQLKDIDPGQIEGYGQEEYSHLGVAAAIVAGRADCGLGIPAAAHALGLEFIHLFDEQYDLVIPEEHAASSLLAPLFQVLGNTTFRKSVSALAGYDPVQMGVLLSELDGQEQPEN